MDANGFRLVRRRSDRLYEKHRSEVMFTSCDGPMGIFRLLPLELHHAILDCLTHSDLTILSSTSSLFACLIREYLVSCRHLEVLLFSSSCLRPPERQGQAFMLRDQFVSLGDLLRSVTCLMPARERYRLLTSVLAKLQSVHSLILNQSGSTAAYSCFGALLKQLVGGWSFHDKRSVFQMIWQEASLETRCQQIFTNTAGTFPFHEVDIRLLIRNVFLQHPSATGNYGGGEGHVSANFLCWLTLLLKSWPLVNQARLLVTLFGPLHPSTGTVDWQKLCSTTSGVSCSKQDLAELAYVMSALYRSPGTALGSGGDQDTPKQLAWVPDQVVSIVDEATALPHGWSLDNMGRLLQLLCRPLTVNLLQCYAANGRLSELAHLVLHMALVCADDDGEGSGQRHGAETHCCKAELSYFVEVLRDVLSIFTIPVRKQFLQQFFNTWHEHILDIYQVSEDSIQMNMAVRRMTNMCEVLSQYIFI